MSPYILIRSVALLLAAPFALAAQQPPAPPQDDVDQPMTQPLPAAPDALSLARAAAARGDSAEALSRYLRVLAATPDNVEALAGAGGAALGVGDINAATGFYARAEALDPRNGQVKAGLARVELQKGDARNALRLFRDAVTAGVPAAQIASDRGLAYDLRGSSKRAQEDYQLAIQTNPNDRESIRRLALSQAIAGEQAAAMTTLDPLLRQQDVPAWRARAFVFALTGDSAAAVTGAALVMPKDQVDALTPYLSRLAALKPADKAAAIHLGRFPGEGAPPPQRTGAVAAAPKLPLDRGVLTSPAPVLAEAPSAPAPTPAPAPQPSAPPPHQPTRAERQAEARARQKAQAEAAQKLAEKKNPARHWVQVAGGANKRDLGRAWSKLKDKWPKLLAGRSPWTLHYRYTNRLLIGPFASSDAAQDWVSDARKDGFATFRVETNAGDAVEHIGG
ncbi:SPOR domain-containing protein [Sphingomonas nostoxanthinifaciens]|uniref:SPOR domain-containing protein n=1 Tax=Sphingomonas nostoxanthinifaciens TaxID=2872652 RepID=UPI001CC2023A|nr:SPOR domain-containing protein [Sphingomonas nostoxanthinifaciens]UAK24947.1 SPOR domain-containing protein [Sphingomonas nostoxanthinifaciens]